MNVQGKNKYFSQTDLRHFVFIKCMMNMCFPNKVLLDISLAVATSSF